MRNKRVQTSSRKLKKNKRAKRKLPQKKYNTKRAIKKKTAGLSPQEARILKRYGNNLPSMIASIKKMEQLEASTNKHYTDLLREYEAKQEQLGIAAETLDSMEKKRNNISKDIKRLERLSDLQDFLDDNMTSEQDLAELIDEKNKLKQAGFDLGSIKLVAKELARLGTDPREVARMMERWAPKARTLEQTLALVEQSIAEARNEVAQAQARLDSLNTEADKAKAGIRALEDHLASQSRNLESEYEARRRVLDSKMQEERTRREAETMELLKLRDEAATTVQALKEKEATIKNKISKDESQKT